MSSGSVTVVKPVQRSNAASSSVTPLGSRISVKLLQPQNALRPIFSTLSGSTTPVSLLQFQNAIPPIATNPSGNCTSVKLLQP